MAPPGNKSNHRVFGQATRSNNKGSRYQRQLGGGGGNRYPSNNGSGKSHSLIASDDVQLTEQQRLAQRRAEYKKRRQQEGEELDFKFGYERFGVSTARPGETKRGWLFNLLPTTALAPDGPELAGLDLYFTTDSGQTFKSTVLYRPYFYLMPKLPSEEDSALILETMTSALHRMLEGILHQVEIVHRVDLDQPNHLAPKNRSGRPMLKLIFDNVSQLTEARALLMEIVKKNKKQEEEQESFMFLEHDAGFGSAAAGSRSSQQVERDPLTLLTDIREYDVPYVIRVCTDLDIRAGTWYTVEPDNDRGVVLSEADVERKGNPSYMAFDIECTKAPLKFPDANVDTIFMISYMVSGKGYLIVARDVVAQDINDFEYTPKPSYPGPFHIFNEKDEEALLRRFFDEYKRLRPQIVVTYNGDFFDWPFVEQRAAVYGLDIWIELGVEKVGEEYRGRCSVHLDAFHWVQRDSYLPQGSQGLKAVTKYKLGYDPVEVDPEHMVRYAQERPTHMATYSVSDAVATYYLYEKYVHLFIFSLCTIIPVGPEDVLRKGSGTLCEVLLMVQAYHKSIICPNKQVDPLAKFHRGHLLESETYIGGKVECLETGVYRSDIEYEFQLKPSCFQMLIDNIDRDLTFAIEVEGGLMRSDIVNYDEVRGEIVSALEALRERPNRTEKPYIYHLDIGAMYPNIILTNRLQPSSIVDDAMCAACHYNQTKNGCKRRMEWIWRGDYSPATRNEYDRTKDQLSREVVKDGTPFHALPESEQAILVANRLKIYARNAYKKVKVTEEETRNDVVCMRENDYYVDTVRQFRDRRYEYKKLTKTWKKKVDEAKDPTSKKEAEDRTLVYDSLQVAHKCILNSFYGYVMRKGARWRSMEMAGIVTKTGADLITQARIIVEQIGRPLELDTDGIWCILPKSFPAVYTFISKDGSKSKIEYPGVMLNADVNKHFTNHQYQTLVDPERGIYKTHSECSLFFEVDGPYRCMVLPASTEEGKLLKKRYAVFNFDGSLAELKGFELKRRGELELIKTFQSQVFERFLDGETLEACYDSVAEIANHWLDVIDTRGESLDDDELIDLISENRSMSRQLEDYGDQKGTSQTTARRLGEFLGAEIIKDKGLNCKFIIAEQPYGAPVTDRAIPTAIWKAEPAVMIHFLRKWLKSPGLEAEAFDIRNVLDWDYYLERLSKTIQKIITIPAALQDVKNPVPRISHPDWLNKKVRQMKSRFQQKSIQSMFKPKDDKSREAATGDIEDAVAGADSRSKRPIVRLMKRADKKTSRAEKSDDADQDTARRVELSKESFGDWLQQRKNAWRMARKRRRGQEKTGSSRQQESKRLRSQLSSIEGFVRDAALALTQREWQVIEVREMTSVDQAGTSVAATGEVVAWIMIGGNSLQKIYINVPRTVYVSSRCEIDLSIHEHISIKKVERYLPHGKSAPHLYEISMPEYVFRTKEWTSALKPVNWNQKGSFLDSIYESATPPVFRVLSELGCVSKVNKTAEDGGKGQKSYNLRELCRLDRPTEGEYLSARSQFKRIFLYFRVHPRSKVGIVALFVVDAPADAEVDLTRPNSLPNGTFDIGASCHFWIVRPGSAKGPKNVSVKQAESLLSQILETVHTASQESVAEGNGADYLSIFPASSCKVSSLNFSNNEISACTGINEVITSHTKSYGPTFLFVNSSKELQQLRRLISGLNSFPVIPLPFPPGPAHNPALSTLPALNWELPAIQLCMEAYLHMNVVSFPKRASYARYGHLAIGNLGDDEASVVYDVSLARQLGKSRAISWASRVAGQPDLGQNFLPSSDCSTVEIGVSSALGDQNQLWGGEDELISPVIRRPGCYRTVCVDFDIHDLAIAALTDATLGQSVGQNNSSFDDMAVDPSSPNSVCDRIGGLTNKVMSSFTPLGNDMSTSIALSVVRGLANMWLHDAFSLNSHVADDLLHHVYRMISSPETLMHDPALHRSILSLMKVTFYRLLSELQRLGCTIVCANFHKVTVSTSKSTLAEAEEYADFIVSTIRNRAGSGGHQALAGLGRVALQPRQFHNHFLFLDEYNFGGMLLERQSKTETDENDQLVADDDESEAVLPSVVSAWSIMRYLGSGLAQEYFRVIVGKFSKDVLREEMALRKLPDSRLTVQPFDDPIELLLAFKKKLISKHFAAYATRAISEILNDDSADSNQSRALNPALEFIKNITAVFELDSDVEAEVYSLKKSMLAQVGVPEYAEVAQWRNPCQTFILPDVFCVECFDSRDVNLCYTSTADGDHWCCEDCGTLYDIGVIERRLVDLACLKLTRYQMQDLFCSKTKRVGTRALARQSDCSAAYQLDHSIADTRKEIEVLRGLAQLHGLEYLLETTEGILSGFPS